MDTFLNLRIFGFSLRFVFIPILLLITFSIYYICYVKEKLKFLGIFPALIWLLFLIAFIPNTSILVRNIAYVVWLIIYFAFIPILPIFVRYDIQFVKVIKYYLLSFSIVAVFSILQFIFGVFNIDLLIQQRWANGLPRASGFSYEPSYLATYMIIGWIICFYLIISKSYYRNYLNVHINIIFISLAIFFSGSRMGILFILLIPSIYIIYSLKSIIKNLKINKLAVKYFLIIAIAVSSTLVYFTYHFDQALVYLNGLGIMGTVSHSYVMRSNDQEDTFKAFKKSPIIGYSLGGLPTQVALIRGKTITTQKEAKDYEGLNIFAEVLAASGIIGFMFFAYYFYLLFKKSIMVSKLIKVFNPEFYKIAMAILLAFFCELLILIFNQNILRAYLWVHIAIVNCVFYVMVNMVKQKNTSQII